MSDYSQLFDECKRAHEAAFTELENIKDQVLELGNQCIRVLKSGGKIVLFGNGGSASDAQHIAAEFVVRYKRNRKALPAIALTTDTSILTACSNDFGYETVFERQVEAMVSESDLVIGISTSGTSANVLSGLNAAKAKKTFCVSFTGSKASPMSELADLAILAPGNETARIQEVHIFIGHMICDMVDQYFSESP